MEVSSSWRKDFFHILSYVSGFGYCSLNNSGTRYKQSVTLSNKGFREASCRLKKQANVKAYGVNIAPNVWKLYTSKSSQEPQPLACHGAAILAISKIILMGGIEFMLKHLRPDKAQLLYLDTDSMHIALNEPIFENNVAKHMKTSFDAKKYYFLDEESAASGMLVIESIVDYEQIFAEKFYVLKMKSEQNPKKYIFNDKIKSLACKGIPQRILNTHRSEIDDLDPSYGYQESAICRLGINLGVSNSVRFKVLGGLMVPSRRFFFDNANSIPFTFPNTSTIAQPFNQIPDQRHYLREGAEISKKKKQAKSKICKNQSRAKTFSVTKKQKHSSVLSKLMSKEKSSSDIIDIAYKNAISRSSDINDVIYVPPKKKKKNVFIDYECKS